LANKPGKPERRPSARPPAPQRPPPVPAPPPRKPPVPTPARARAPEVSAPEITVHKSTVGRDTLAAIVDEMGEHEAPTAIREQAPPMGAFRPEMPTLGYEQRPRPVLPETPRAPLTSSPEVIVVGEAPVGRATMAAIEEELTASFLELTAPAEPAAKTKPEPTEVFEIVTFVVKGGEIFSKASEDARREFVGKYLRHRLPVASMKDVKRIDASPGAERGSVILRVWCRLSLPTA
jgi:hypothetical protein